MITFNANVFPLNDLEHNPNARGSTPLVKEWHSVTPGALTAGKVAVDLTSIVGKDVGEVVGAQVLGAGKEGEVLGATVVPHATLTGKVTVTIFSSDATSTYNPGTLTVEIYGRVTGS